MYNEKYAVYQRSESYAFKKVKKALDQNDYSSFIRSGNTWLSKLNGSFSTLQDFVKNFGTKELDDILKEINENYFKYHKTSNKNSFRSLSQELSISRRKYLEAKKISTSGSKNNKWLNPTSTD